MNQELVSQVEELGLSEKEAKVYIANLLIGPAPVQKIADSAGIKRVTTYVILESLVNMGLVSQTTKGKKTYFIAEEPISLRRLLEKKEQELSDQKRHFESILPELAALKSFPKESPNVKFYDSVEGIKSIMSTFLLAHKHEGIKHIYGMSNLDHLYAFFPEFRSAESNPARVSAGIRSQIIYTSAAGPIFRESDTAKLRESRFVPADKYPINGDMSIVGDNITMLSLSGHRPVGVTIHSEELAKTMLAMFMLAWEAAGKYNQ